MPSQTEIVNYSLDMVNVSPILDLDANDGKAQKCKRLFEKTLREALSEDDWKFAKKRISIAADATAPISEWLYAYTLPADCLKPQRVNDDDSIAWEVEGRKILTDTTAPIILEYTKLSTDPNEWTGEFSRYFNNVLAARYAEAFPQDNDKSRIKMAEAQNDLHTAIAKNGQTGPVHVPQVTTLTGVGVRRF